MRFNDIKLSAPTDTWAVFVRWRNIVQCIQRTALEHSIVPIEVGVLTFFSRVPLAPACVEASADGRIVSWDERPVGSAAKASYFMLKLAISKYSIQLHVFLMGCYLID